MESIFNLIGEHDGFIKYDLPIKYQQFFPLTNFPADFVIHYFD